MTYQLIGYWSTDDDAAYVTVDIDRTYARRLLSLHHRFLALQAVEPIAFWEFKSARVKVFADYVNGDETSYVESEYGPMDEDMWHIAGSGWALTRRLRLHESYLKLSSYGVFWNIYLPFWGHVESPSISWSSLQAIAHGRLCQSAGSSNRLEILP